MSSSYSDLNEVYARHNVNYNLPIDDNIENIIDLLQPKLEQNYQKTALRMGQATLSFEQLDIASKRFAAFLQSQGMIKGDRVAVQLPNILQYPVVMLGCLRSGMVLVNVNPLYTHYELAHQITDADVRGLILLTGMDTAYQQLEDSVKSSLDWVMHCSVTGDSAAQNDILALMQLETSLSSSSTITPSSTIDNNENAQPQESASLSTKPHAIKFADAINNHHENDFKMPDIGREDLALLQYTGGTTGKPKGAMLSHYNVLANILQCYECFGAYVEEKSTQQVKMLNPLPLYHIFSFTVCGLLSLYGGWEDILVTNPRDMDNLIDVIDKHKPNIIPSVNTLFIGMLSHPKFANLDFSELYLSIGGGTAIIRAVAERWEKVTGQTINEGYGMSETSPVISFNPPSVTEFNGTVGLPLSLTVFKIFDDAGNECAVGEPGEVCIKGPQVMKGYWQRDNDQTFTAEGFLKTGDIGFIDESGFVTLVDRKKDMILVSGFNVYPNEVEAALTEHPKVKEVAVVGVADDYSGEAPKAFVVKNDESLTVEELQAFASERMTGYKRPKYYEFIAELPKSAVGKILRKELR